MAQAHPGSGVDIWLRNIFDYAHKVYDTPFARENMTMEDRESLYEIYVQASRLREKYVMK